MIGAWIHLAVSLMIASAFFMAAQETMVTVIGLFFVLEGLVYLGWSYRQERKRRAGRQDGSVEPEGRS